MILLVDLLTHATKNSLIDFNPLKQFINLHNIFKDFWEINF